MKTKKIGGVITIVIGIILIIVSLYIKNRVGEEKGSVREKEEEFDKGTGLLPSSPYKDMATGKIKGSIDQAVREKAGPYETFAKWSLVGGIVLIVVGGGVVVCCRRKR